MASSPASALPANDVASRAFGVDILQRDFGVLRLD
jgi:hypothetical protein